MNVTSSSTDDSKVPTRSVTEALDAFDLIADQIGARAHGMGSAPPRLAAELEDRGLSVADEMLPVLDGRPVPRWFAPSSGRRPVVQLSVPLVRPQDSPRPRGRSPILLELRNSFGVPLFTERRPTAPMMWHDHEDPWFAMFPTARSAIDSYVRFWEELASLGVTYVDDTYGVLDEYLWIDFSRGRVGQVSSFDSNEEYERSFGSFFRPLYDKIPLESWNRLLSFQPEQIFADSHCVPGVEPPALMPGCDYMWFRTWPKPWQDAVTDPFEDP